MPSAQGLEHRDAGVKVLLGGRGLALRDGDGETAQASPEDLLDPTCGKRLRFDDDVGRDPSAVEVRPAAAVPRGVPELALRARGALCRGDNPALALLRISPGVADEVAD